MEHGRLLICWALHLRVERHKGLGELSRSKSRQVRTSLSWRREENWKALVFLGAAERVFTTSIMYDRRVYKKRGELTSKGNDRSSFVYTSELPFNKRLIQAQKWVE